MIAARLLLGVGIVVVAVAGMTLPRTLIDDGVNRFQGEERDMAWAARSYAVGDIFDGETPTALIVTRIRVESVKAVERCPILEREAKVCGKACKRPDPMMEEMSARDLRINKRLDRVEGEFTAILRAHTIFGLPFDTLHVNCEGELAEY